MIYDILILGAGPAGLTAAIYAARYKRKVLIIEKAAVGGQIVLTSEIENFPGQNLSDESGITLTERMLNQALSFGVEKISANIIKTELCSDIKRLISDNGTIFEGKSVIIASGGHFRKIGCENEEKFIGAGISFCATCDANFFTDLDVFVAGGGDSAVEEALYLTKFAKSVTIIHRRNELRATKTAREKAFANSKIKILYDSIVTKAEGDDVLTSITVKNVKSGEEKVYISSCDDDMIGLFGFLGIIPDTDIFADTGINLSESGHIIADESTETNIKGVFAAGDVRTKELRQVVTACSDGAIAAFKADRYIESI